MRALQRAGFVISRSKGSHTLMVHPQALERRAIVPVHGNAAVKPGTLHAILKGAGLTVEQFKDLL